MDPEAEGVFRPTAPGFQEGALGLRFGVLAAGQRHYSLLLAVVNTVAKALLLPFVTLGWPEFS